MWFAVSCSVHQLEDRIVEIKVPASMMWYWLKPFVLVGLLYLAFSLYLSM